MYMELAGYKILDFESNGEQVKGTQAFVLFKEDDDDLVGRRTDRLFFKNGFELPDFKPGMTLDVEFNRKGKPVKVTAVSASQRLNISKQ